jgi:hypothetical protein
LEIGDEMGLRSAVKPRPRFETWVIAKLATTSPPPTEFTVDVDGRGVPAGNAATKPALPSTDVTL